VVDTSSKLNVRWWYVSRPVMPDGHQIVSRVVRRRIKQAVVRAADEEIALHRFVSVVWQGRGGSHGVEVWRILSVLASEQPDHAA
jgi:hypothetical protein